MCTLCNKNIEECLYRMKYFFSLILEDYEKVGDKEELMVMAGVTEEEIEAFLSEEQDV